MSLASELAKLFDVTDFPARWSCGNWTLLHGWVHIVSDTAIGLAYLAIPLVLVWFVRRRPDVPFPRVFWLFGAFILSCGAGHLIEASIFWHPWYRLSGLSKLLTATVSWATVVVLVPLMPRALELPGLVALNRQLSVEVERHGATERDLVTRNAELERFHALTGDREDRVLELKQEVNELLARLGEVPRYGAGRHAAS